MQHSQLDFPFQSLLAKKEEKSFPLTKSHSGTNVALTLVPILQMTATHLCVSLFQAQN